MKKKLTLIVTALLVILICCSCANKPVPGAATDEKETNDATTKPDGESTIVNDDGEVVSKPIIAEITMASGGKITLELDSAAAPKSVENFVKLANDGFYDGLIFHRVIPGFMIQGGDPNGDGSGGSDDIVPGEFAANGWKDNTISHVRGVISMARKQLPLDSATSQFFITNADSTFLDGDYAAFGVVTSGMEVVDEISAVKTNANDKPLEDVVIESIKILD